MTNTDRDYLKECLKELCDYAAQGYRLCGDNLHSWLHLECAKEVVLDNIEKRLEK